MAIINNNFHIREKKVRHPALRWFMFAASSVVIGAVIANTNFGSESEVSATEEYQTIDLKTNNLIEDPSPQERIAHQSIALSLPELQAQQEIIDNLHNIETKKWREFKVRSGDNMALLFKRAGIKANQLAAVMASGKAAKQLRSIYPKDIIRVLTDDQGKLVSLHYDIDHKSYLMVERGNDESNPDKLVSDIYKYKIRLTAMK